MKKPYYDHYMRVPRLWASTGIEWFNRTMKSRRTIRLFEYGGANNLFEYQAIDPPRGPPSGTAAFITWMN
jgi:hypothetical protein